MTPEAERRLFYTLGQMSADMKTVVAGQAKHEKRLDALDAATKAKSSMWGLIAGGFGAGAVAMVYKLFGIAPPTP